MAQWVGTIDEAHNAINGNVEEFARPNGVKQRFNNTEQIHHHLLKGTTVKTQHRLQKQMAATACDLIRSSARLPCVQV